MACRKNALIAAQLPGFEAPECDCLRGKQPVQACLWRRDKRGRWAVSPRGCFARQAPSCVTPAHPDGCDRLWQRGRCPDLSCPAWRWHQCLERPCPDHPGPESQEAPGCPHCHHWDCGRCDCGWTYGPPCRHVLAAESRVPVSLREWGELGLAADPAAYGEPGALDSPQVFLTRQAKADVLRRRKNRGLALRHPGDLTEQDVPEVGIEPVRLSNGSTAEVGLRLHREWAEEEVEAEEKRETDALLAELWDDRSLELLHRRVAAAGRLAGPRPPRRLRLTDAVTAANYDHAENPQRAAA